MLFNDQLSRPPATKTTARRRLPCQHRYRFHRWTSWLPLTSGIHAYTNWTGGHYRLEYKQCRHCDRSVIRKHRLTQPWRKEFTVPINQVTRPWVRVIFVIITFVPFVLYSTITNLLLGVFTALSDMLDIASGER